MTSPHFSALEIAAALGQFPPTPQQQAVIEAPLEPQLVVAGAGSGKTETMAARVVWLVANDVVAPQEILGLTFTRKAAGELSDRVAARLRTLAQSGLWRPPVDEAVLAEAPRDVENASAETGFEFTADLLPTISTYHSYAGSIVRDHGLLLGVEPDARLLSQAASWQYAHQIVSGWDERMEGISNATDTVVTGLMSMAGELAEHLQTPDAVREFYSLVDKELDDLPRAPRTRSIGEGGKALQSAQARHLAILPLVERYQQLKHEHSSLDFSDQVAFAAKLARDFPRVGVDQRQRYRMVLLDEFQDTSEAQISFLAALFARGDDPVGVTAVGDPHQSIFAWRGASASTLSKFAREFRLPETTSTPVLSLSTSWRNDAAILACANVTASPLTAASKVDVARLDPRPGAGAGSVDVARYETAVDEAAAVAEWIAARRAEKPNTTAAVLCRKRSQFAAILEAFASRDIPAEAVGLGGLLSTPEVVDLLNLLWVVDDPTRGDKFMRLLTHGSLRLGPADLVALHRWAKELHELLRAEAEQYLAEQGLGSSARDDDGPEDTDDAEAEGARMAATRQDTHAAKDLAAETRDEVSLVEAIGRLPEADWRGRDGEYLSDDARTRLAAFSVSLERLRALSGLPLADFIAEAERVLGLDIEVLARPGYDDPSTARAHLDAFADVAGTFSAQAERPTLGAFLAWLHAAESEERGLELPAIEVNPNAVQVLTVHASKGLEWDVVAVPGLNQGVFPSLAGRTMPAGQEWEYKANKQDDWLTGFGSIPYELRGDQEDLPEFEFVGAEDNKDLTERLKAFTEAGVEKAVADERRLAYVAFTRARSSMLLTAPVWTVGSDSPRAASQFLEELLSAADRGLVALNRLEWAPMPKPLAGGNKPVNPLSEMAQQATWPHDPMQRARQQLGDGPLKVASLRGVEAEQTATWDGLPLPGTAADRDLEVDLLLAERDRARQRGTTRVAVPAHLSTSALVRMREDPESFAVWLRRPMPTEPAVAARRGTAFHAWVEQHYKSAALVDIDELPGFDDESATATEDLAQLQENFLASEWARRQPIAVEVNLETVIAGFAIRGRVDAVFAREDGGYTIVDWKTGRRPNAAALQARVYQLGSYAVAFARLHGLEQDKVDGAFFYAASGETVRPKLPDANEIAAALTGSLGEG